MSKKNESSDPSPSYSQTKAQWRARFDDQAAKDRTSESKPRLDVATAQKALRLLRALAASSDAKARALLAPLAHKGIDHDFFAALHDYETELAALSALGTPDLRDEALVAPAERQLVSDGHALLFALRNAAGKAAESVDRVEDAKALGRGKRVNLNAQSLLDGIQVFLTGAKLCGPLLHDAGIGAAELGELEAYVPQLKAITQSKEERTAARGNRAANIELILLALDSALALYRSRATTALHKTPALLNRALTPLPRATERRKTDGGAGEGTGAPEEEQAPEAKQADGAS